MAPPAPPWGPVRPDRPGPRPGPAGRGPARPARLPARPRPPRPSRPGPPGPRPARPARPGPRPGLRAPARVFRPASPARRALLAIARFARRGWGRGECYAFLPFRVRHRLPPIPFGHQLADEVVGRRSAQPPPEGRKAALAPANTPPALDDQPEEPRRLTTQPTVHVHLPDPADRRRRHTERQRRLLVLPPAAAGKQHTHLRGAPRVPATKLNHASDARKRDRPQWREVGRPGPPGPRGSPPPPRGQV